MSKSRGVFNPSDIERNHEHLEVGEPRDLPLPDKLEYRVPSTFVQQFKDKKGRLKHQVGNAGTLARPTLARMLYMDVGRWGGSAPSHKSTTEHWGRRRDFGIV
jgi:hypothetical protein